MKDQRSNGKKEKILQLRSFKKNKRTKKQDNQEQSIKKKKFLVFSISLKTQMSESQL